MQILSAPIRRGTTLTELVVAASLLVGSLGIIAQLTVRTGRLWQDIRHQQLALDELSNQIERLTALDQPLRSAALAELVPSVPIQRTLPSAKLSAETLPDADGTRLVVSINWDRRTKSSPLSLVAWIDPMQVSTDPSEGAQP